MAGEKDLNQLLKNLKPILNQGQYVFVSVANPTIYAHENIIGFFREKEGSTLIIEKEYADEMKLPYEFIASWITLNVHSDLEAVGLTAKFSRVLAKNNISCNVVAGYYHDHIFVGHEDAQRSMKILSEMAAA